MIALLAPDPEWQELLGREGVDFAVGDWSAKADAAVLPRRPARSEARRLRAVVEDGGALLAAADAAAVLWPDLRVKPGRLRYLVPDGSPFFRNVGLVDLASTGWLVAGAEFGRTERGRPAILAGRCGRGWRVVLPFDLSRLFLRCGTTARRFPAEMPRLPSETVARVGRGEVRRLVANCLRYLFWSRGLPYVHKAMVPSGTSAFGFRVDDDVSTARDIETTARAGAECGLKLSWYVNVGAHASLLGLFRQLDRSGEDVQVHCYRHRVYRTQEQNHANLARAMALMSQAGMQPVGTVAPYGDWNFALARAMAQLGLRYSSEFAVGYDDVPFRPLVDGSPTPVLQVPVHPICLGRLAAVRATRGQMLRYFRSYIDRQAARLEPCLLYDHPQQVAREHAVVEQVLTYGSRTCGSCVTLTGYADWWRRREAAHYVTSFHEGGAVLDVDEAPPELVPLVVERDGRYALLRGPGRFEDDRLDWRESPTPPAGIEWERVCRPSSRDRLGDRVRRYRKFLQTRGK